MHVALHDGQLDAVDLKQGMLALPGLQQPGLQSWSASMHPVMRGCYHAAHMWWHLQCTMPCHPLLLTPQDCATVGNGVEVKPSRLPNAGNGLYATTDFYKNDLITMYDGINISHKAALNHREHGRASHILSLQSNFLYVNGTQDPTRVVGRGGASFANDGRGVVPYNCKYAYTK